MRLAKTLMVQGTASTVGKSTVVAGLCRIFAQEGWRVAPFKAQNMALNSWVTRAGEEMGRAQVVQAEAAGVEPQVEMNPILLKPEGDSRSQVIVMGRPLAAMEAREYFRNRAMMLPIVEQALHTLRSQYDLIIIEGAGSPVELNLAQYDLVNMRIAQMADAPVLLVGDIDRGGIFASLLGTLMLLEPAERARIKGLIVNKFRGDLTLWQDGERLLAERSGVPVLGTIPYFRDIRIAEEDVVALDEGSAALLRGEAQTSVAGTQLEIVIVRLPYLSNYDEFDALAAEPLVNLRIVAKPEEVLERVDLIILPGTKNTIADLAWLWRSGLAQRIIDRVRAGSAVLGICGGYQMLGEFVHDALGVEGEPGKSATGLKLLPLQTEYAALEQKVTARSRVWLSAAARRGLFAHVSEQDLQVYQIHLGRTMAGSSVDNDTHEASQLFCVDEAERDGWLSADGWVAGCYMHGLYENAHLRQALLIALAERRGIEVDPSTLVHFDRQLEYDRLAQVLREHLDLAQLKQQCEL